MARAAVAGGARMAAPPAAPRRHHLPRQAGVRHAGSFKTRARPSWADESEPAKVTYDLLFSNDTKFPEEIRSNPFVARLLADQGWSQEAEILNGRLAMLGALHMTLTSVFLGDVLVQVANSPGPLVLLMPLITAASIAPRVGDEPLVPAAVRDPLMDAYNKADGPEIFTPELELAVGRLAMVAMGGFLVLAVVF
eukprot:jgi/Tetstr1/430267/TSEL_020095.t1